jgi:crotonobetainyl-CoA:carnitine CoA-transferase CaiB-like acyl-CoA transferase
MRLTVRDAQGQPVELVGSPFHISTAKGGDEHPTLASAPPGLGQHSEEVLHDWLGLDGEQIARLREQGAI